ncbi:hypothetical protein LBMAG53_35860 [Planctomycetota bacterium]|nr:hypothetical protein LBMAG53_35860 [Planctomycetota bacterium]
MRLYLSWAALSVTLLAAALAALAIAAGYPIDLPFSKPKLANPGQMALVLRWIAGGLGFSAVGLGVVGWAMGGPWRLNAVAVVFGFAVLALEWFVMATVTAMMVVVICLALFSFSS